MPSRRPLTFDTFVTTAGSHQALDRCRRAAAQAPGAPRSLVLIGPTGCGKTHLLCALAAAVTTAGPADGTESGIVYTTGHDLRARLVLALRVGAPTDDLIARPGTRLAVVDDLQSLREHPASQALIARSWAAAVRAGVTVVGACSGSAEPIAPLREALGPDGAGWVAMTRPTKAEALRILDTLIVGYQVVRDDTTTRRVLDGWNGDVRRLVGAAVHGAFGAGHQPASLPPWVRSA